MFKVKTFNSIAQKGLDVLPLDQYEVGPEVVDPDAIILRSHKLHDMVVPESLKAVGRAGAGVNNVPVDALSKLGIPVFNAPGANANAVKELVIAGMLMAARNIPGALKYADSLTGDDEMIHKATEAGKKKFVGSELPGRTLGVIGLGAIGVQVANSALALGMEVIGFDPQITVHRAWQLSAGVEQALSIEDLLSRSDFVSVHVPLNEHTRNMFSAERIRSAKDGIVVLNFARDGIVDSAEIIQAIGSGKVSCYVCDFPDSKLIGQPGVIALPHLGASTGEAEVNCAVMVARQLKDFLENGNINNSVNFPSVTMPRTDGYRLAISNANVPNMLAQISAELANHDLNIVDMLNKSRGEYAYTLVDVDKAVSEKSLEALRAIDGILTVRVIH